MLPTLSSLGRRLARPPLPLAALLALVGLLGWIYGAFVAHPSRYFVGDLVSYYQPIRAHVAACLRQGDLPLWSPALFAGTPLVADAQIGLFYPPNLLHLGVPFPAAELVLLLAHLAWMGLGATWLARRLGADGAAALVAGLGCSGSGFFVVHAVHPNFIHTAAWVPWLLGLLHGVAHHPTRRRVAAAAAITGLVLLSGGLQIAYLGLALTTLLGLAWSLGDGRRDLRYRLRTAGAVLLALCGGIALAAVQLWPTGEFAALSVRAHGVTLDLARSYAVTPRQLLSLVVPFAFGIPGQTPYRGGAPFGESFGYAGVLLVPLAATGALAARGRWRSPDRAGLLTRWLLVSAVLAALGVALGREGPVDLHRLAWRLLPGFDRFRAPGRLLYVAGFGLSVLAALGLSDLLRALAPRCGIHGGARPACGAAGGAAPDSRGSRALGIFSVATALTAGLCGAVLLLVTEPSPLLPPPTAALARRASVLALGLLAALWLLLRLAPRWGAPRGAVLAGVLALLAVDLGGAGRRVAATLRPPAGTDLARTAHRLPERVRAEATRPTGARPRLTFTPNSYFMLQNLGLMRGWDNLRAYSPVLLRRTWELLTLANTGSLPPKGWRLAVDHNHHFLRRPVGPIPRLLGVRWLLSHDRGGRPGVRRRLRWRVRELPGALPRAFVVHRSVLARQRGRVAALLARLPLDRVALVSEPDGVVGPPPAAAPNRDARGPAMPRAGTARIVDRNRCTGAAEIAVQPRSKGLLVFTEGYHPGWRAQVDGRSATLVRVDHALLGVVLPAGARRVTLRFSPRSLLGGAAISGGALLLLLGALCWPRRRRGGPGPLASPEEPPAPPTGDPTDADAARDRSPEPARGSGHSPG